MHTEAMAMDNIGMSDKGTNQQPHKDHRTGCRQRTLLEGCRAFVAIMLAVVVTGLISGSSAARADTLVMSAEEVHEAALAGEVILLDIRTPEEWQETGIPASGHPVSMHVPGFLDKLNALNDGDRSRPIALICARGNRSAFLKRELNKRGFSQVIDVSEGMVGGEKGAGWIARGLPLAAVRDAAPE